ncbi:hypothetical protein P9112_012521 [Eukaryota sp. TZLM1-RC]
MPLIDVPQTPFPFKRASQTPLLNKVIEYSHIPVFFLNNGSTGTKEPPRTFKKEPSNDTSPKTKYNTPHDYEIHGLGPLTEFTENNSPLLDVGNLTPSLNDDSPCQMASSVPNVEKTPVANVRLKHLQNIDVTPEKMPKTPAGFHCNHLLQLSGIPRRWQRLVNVHNEISESMQAIDVIDNVPPPPFECLSSEKALELWLVENRSYVDQRLASTSLQQFRAICFKRVLNNSVKSILTSSIKDYVAADCVVDGNAAKTVVFLSFARLLSISEISTLIGEKLAQLQDSQFARSLFKDAGWLRQVICEVMSTNDEVKSIPRPFSSLHLEDPLLKLACTNPISFCSRMIRSSLHDWTCHSSLYINSIIEKLHFFDTDPVLNQTVITELCTIIESFPFQFSEEEAVEFDSANGYVINLKAIIKTLTNIINLFVDNFTVEPTDDLTQMIELIAKNVFQIPFQNLSFNLAFYRLVKCFLNYNDDHLAFLFPLHSFSRNQHDQHEFEYITDPGKIYQLKYVCDRVKDFPNFWGSLILAQAATTALSLSRSFSDGLLLLHDSLSHFLCNLETMELTIMEQSQQEETQKFIEEVFNLYVVAYNGVNGVSQGLYLLNQIVLDEDLDHPLCKMLNNFSFLKPVVFKYIAIGRSLSPISDVVLKFNQCLIDLIDLIVANVSFAIGDFRGALDCLIKSCTFQNDFHFSKSKISVTFEDLCLTFIQYCKDRSTDSDFLIEVGDFILDFYPSCPLKLPVISEIPNYMAEILNRVPIKNNGDSETNNFESVFKQRLSMLFSKYLLCLGLERDEFLNFDFSKLIKVATISKTKVHEFYSSYPFILNLITLYVDQCISKQCYADALRLTMINFSITMVVFSTNKDLLAPTLALLKKTFLARGNSTRVYFNTLQDIQLVITSTPIKRIITTKVLEKLIDFELANTKKVLANRDSLFQVISVYSFYLLVLVLFVIFGPSLLSLVDHWLDYAPVFVFGAFLLENVIFLICLITTSWPLSSPSHDKMQKKKFLLERKANLKQVSLLITCHNSAIAVPPTLEAALKVFPPENIYICDNGNSKVPTDNTKDVVHSMCSKVNYLWISEGSKTMACYVASKFHAVTPYVLVIDDDVLLPEKFSIDVSKFDDVTKAIAITIAAANTRSSNGKHLPVVEFQSLEYLTAGFSKLFQSQYGSALFCHGAIGCWERSTYVKVLERHNGVFRAEDLTCGIILQELGKGYRIETIGHDVITTVVPNHWVCKRLFRCKCPEASLVKQRCTSWEPGSHRIILRMVKLLLFYWSRPNLILKPFLIYDLYCVIMDYVKILFIWYIIWQDPWPVFVGLVLSFIVYEILLLVFNYFTLRNRPDLQNRLMIILSFPIYRFISQLFRVVGLLYNLLYYVPFSRTPDVYANRNDLPEDETTDYNVHSPIVPVDSNLPFSENIDDDNEEDQAVCDHSKMDYTLNSLFFVIRKILFGSALYVPFFESNQSLMIINNQSELMNILLNVVQFMVPYVESGKQSELILQKIMENWSCSTSMFKKSKLSFNDLISFQFLKTIELIFGAFSDKIKLVVPFEDEIFEISSNYSFKNVTEITNNEILLIIPNLEMLTFDTPCTYSYIRIRPITKEILIFYQKELSKSVNNIVNLLNYRVPDWKFQDMTLSQAFIIQENLQLKGSIPEIINANASFSIKDFLSKIATKSEESDDVMIYELIDGQKVIVSDSFIQLFEK